jgi:hypothetical protein
LLAACVTVCVTTRARADVTLVEKGKPLARIYVTYPLAGAAQPADAGSTRAIPQEPHASLLVEELNGHLKRLSGTELEVVMTDSPAAVKGPAIVLGSLAVKMGADPGRRTESKEGFRLLVSGDRILVGGETDEAALFGLYEMLGQLGCDWVMPGEIGVIAPRQETIRIAEQDLQSAPDFSFRSLWYRGYPQPRLPEERGRMNEWLRRQRSGSYKSFANGAGGHVWDAFIKRHKADFDKDSTMLALRRAPDGALKRQGPQLESTHPRVIELFVQEIREAYRRNMAEGKWTQNTPAAFGVGPADGLGYSVSAESMMAGSGRTDPMTGEADRTDELVLFCNRILAEVNKEYPNAHVGFYSYSTHAGYPTRYKPDPKVVIIFAPINFSRLHGVLDPASKTQMYYRDVVENWGRLSREQGNILIYRGYNWNLAENMLPYSKIRIWGEELPYYKKQGIIGLNVEATKAWSVNGPSDYVFMKLAWDSSQDWRKLLHQYCERAFGAGAESMERYYLLLTDTQHAAGQEAGSYHAFPLMYDRAWVKKALALVDSGMAAAKTENDKTRAGFVRLNLEALQLFLDADDAAKRFDFEAAQKAYDAMLQHWTNSYAINTDLVANEVPQYLKRFVSAFVEQSVQYSTAPYRRVMSLPDELPTLLDPSVVGHHMNFQGPAIQDRQVLRTKTYSSTWDVQGLGGFRDGAVWYRFHFVLPDEARAQSLGLFLGGVEDEARVWLNGELIGSSGRGFSKPFQFDLSDAVKAEGDNVLAIQIVRNSKANEIGLGGILRPSFLFTGPKLEKKAPAVINQERVLPGGG